MNGAFQFQSPTQKKEPAVYPYTAGIAFLVTPSSAKRRR